MNSKAKGQGTRNALPGDAENVGAVENASSEGTDVVVMKTNNRK